LVPLPSLPNAASEKPQIEGAGQTTDQQAAGDVKVVDQGRDGNRNGGNQQGGHDQATLKPLEITQVRLAD